MFRVTRAEELALRLVMRMAQTGGQLTLGQLAEAEALPEPTVAKLLGLLRRAGVTEALRGRYGGYVLARPPRELTVAEILRAVGGQATFGFPCRRPDRAPDCPRATDCGLRPVWQLLNARVTGVLETTSIADLLRSEARASQALQDRWPLTGD